MLDVLAESRPDRTAWLLELRAHAVLGPAVVTMLVKDGVLDFDDLADPERFRFMAEQFLQIIDLAGPEAVLEVVRSMPAGERHEMLADVVDSGHPDSESLAELRALVEEHVMPANVHPLAGLSRRSRNTRRPPKPRNRRR